MIFGDVDIIPSDTAAAWELKGTDVDVVITIENELLRRVAREFPTDPRRVEIRDRFQTRDARIEHIGWAMKAEMEGGYPSGTLYLEGLAVGLAATVVRHHSSLAGESARVRGAVAARRLREAMAFIEENLSGRLSLGEIASVAGLSVSQFGVQFRRATGVSVHQYVVRRRVDRAAELLQRAETADQPRGDRSRVLSPESPCPAHAPPAGRRAPRDPRQIVCGPPYSSIQFCSDRRNVCAVCRDNPHYWE